MTEPIPIGAGRHIAEMYGYDQVVIVARKVGGPEHVTTYGADLANCAVAARIGDFFKHELMRWPREDKPIDMVLHCPACGLQHIDAPGMSSEFDDHTWTNPPHRSHLCHGCGHIWRPADVATNGVAAIKTKGKADSPIGGCAGPHSVAAAQPVGWFESPHGAFRANPDYRIEWPSQLLAWQVPAYISTPPAAPAPSMRALPAGPIPSRYIKPECKP